jgi:hypothetical protein
MGKEYVELRYEGTQSRGYKKGWLRGEVGAGQRLVLIYPYTGPA